MNTIKRNSAAPLVMYIIATVFFIISTVLQIVSQDIVLDVKINISFILTYVFQILFYVILVVHGVLFKLDKTRHMFTAYYVITLVGAIGSFIQNLLSTAEILYPSFETALRVIINNGYAFISLLLYIPIVIDCFVKTGNRTLSRVPLILLIVFNTLFSLATVLSVVVAVADDYSQFNDFPRIYSYGSYLAFTIIGNVFSKAAFLLSTIGSIVYLSKDKPAKNDVVQPYQKLNLIK